MSQNKKRYCKVAALKMLEQQGISQNGNILSFIDNNRGFINTYEICTGYPHVSAVYQQSDGRIQLEIDIILDETVVETEIISMDELKDEKWIMKNFFRYFTVNPIVGKAYKHVKGFILVQIRDLVPIQLETQNGWTHDNFYLAGSTVIGNTDSDGSVLSQEQLPENEWVCPLSTPQEALHFVKDVFLRAASPLIVLTTLMFLLLSLFSSRLKDNADSPQFLLVLRGLSQSGKTAWAVNTLQMMKKWSTNPMASFQDSFAGIIEKAVAVRDSPMIIDDLFPAKGAEGNRMMQIFKKCLRLYADKISRTVHGKNDHPENMLCITCEELPQELTASDNYRMWILTFNTDTIDSARLNQLKNGKHYLSAFCWDFLSWTLDQKNYTQKLYTTYEKYSGLDWGTGAKYRRWQKAAAWLLAQYELFLQYQTARGEIVDIYKEISMYKLLLTQHIQRMAEEFSTAEIGEAVKKALQEIGGNSKYKVYRVSQKHNGESTAKITFATSTTGKILYPSNFLGFEYGDFLCCNLDRLVHYINESFRSNGVIYNLSYTRLLDVMSAEGLLVSGRATGKSRTNAIKINGRQHRVVKIPLSSIAVYEYEEEMI